MARLWCLLSAVLIFLGPLSCNCGRSASNGSIFVRLDAGTPVAEAEEEKDIALSLLRSWALGDERKLFELAEVGTTADELMTSPGEYSAVVIVVRGDHPPQRRNVTAGQPFLTVDPNLLFLDKSVSLEENLPVAAINTAAELLERFLSGPLFPFSVPEDIAQLPTQARAAVEGFTERLFAGVAAAVGAAKEEISDGQADTEEASGAAKAARLVAKISAAALAATLASQVPLWFCVACPIVLGLLAPFAFNLGLGAVAEELCEHYKLPSDECNELWYGAFALAMVLSLASAIPIVYVCRLPDCARRLASLFAPYS